MQTKPTIKLVKSLRGMPRGFFTDNHCIEATRIASIEFTGRKFVNSLLRSCQFEKCKFEGCIFDDMDFQRVNFVDSSFSNCVFSKNFRYITGEIERTTIESSDFSNAFIRNVKMVANVFKSVSFTMMKAKSLDFSRSRFERVDFDGANIVRGTDPAPGRMDSGG